MPLSRRNFVKNLSITTAALTVANPFNADAKAGDTKVRLAFIGTGLRGQAHLATVLKRNDVEIIAICDIDARMLQMSKDIIAKSGKSIPPVYTGNDHSYRNLLALKNIDAVIISTPWEW